MATRPTRRRCMASFVPCSSPKATMMRCVCLTTSDLLYNIDTVHCTVVENYLKQWNTYLSPAFFQAYRWCIEAMKEITPGLPVKVVVDVLRQASKVTNVLLNHNILFTYYWESLHKLSIAQQSVLPGKEIPYMIVWNLTFCLCAAGLCGEERVQKSRAADQTCSVSSKVTCCILKITSRKIPFVIMHFDSMLCVLQRTFWTQASQILWHAARLWILLIKCRQYMPISCNLPGK